MHGKWQLDFQNREKAEQHHQNTCNKGNARHTVSEKICLRLQAEMQSVLKNEKEIIKPPFP